MEFINIVSNWNSVGGYEPEDATGGFIFRGMVITEDDQILRPNRTLSMDEADHHVLWFDDCGKAPAGTYQMIAAQERLLLSLLFPSSDGVSVPPTPAGELPEIARQRAAFVLPEDDEDDQDSDLTDSDLKGANFEGADLRGANFRGVNLKGANFEGAKLKEADLMYADLTDSDLTDSDLTGANLAGANLTGADLRYAKLAEADLTEADLTGANLTGADLRGAILDYVLK